MSLTHPTTLSSSLSSPSALLPNYSKSFSLTTKSIPAFINKKKKNHILLQISCKQNTTQGEEVQILSNNTYRRNLLAGGLGGLTTLAVAAAGLTSQVLMATGSPNKEGSSSSSSSSSSLQKVQEFGSKPKHLKSPIRVLISKPKRPNNKIKREKGTYVLVVNSIEVPNNEPVRFDVYVAKPGGGGDLVGADLGEFAGSLVDLARSRVGRNLPKAGLHLGISCLLKDIGAEDSEKLVVTLMPRHGDVIIGGVHLDYILAHDD